MNNLKALILFTFIYLPLQSGYAQTVSDNENLCNCVGVFDELVEKIEANHIGYHVEIKGKRDAEYKLHIDNYRKKAMKTSSDKCVKILKEFINFYKDGHLYIGQSPKLTDEQVDKLKSIAEKIVRSEKDIRKYLDKNARKLDPIEGIWYSNDKNRFAIFRDKKSKKRNFVAILLSEGNKPWEKGQVKAEFTKLKDDSYEVIYFNEKHYPIYPGGYSRGQKGGAAIRRGLILHMPPVSWGKEYPLNKNPLNKIDSTNPRHPTFQIIDSDNILIAIPSHRPEFAPVLKEFVENNHEKIINAKNLIIDIRGNEGGSSWVTIVLMPYIETTEKRPAKYWVGDEMYVLPSDRNIGYFKNAEKQGWAPKNLVKRAEENFGKLIPFADPKIESSEKKETEQKDEPPKELSKPKNVAILSSSKFR